MTSAFLSCLPRAQHRSAFLHCTGLRASWGCHFRLATITASVPATIFYKNGSCLSRSV